MNETKNRRIIPTSNEIMKNKKFSYEVYLKFQIESNRSSTDTHRYIMKCSINYTKWAKELNLSINTLKKYINNLIDLGILKSYKGDEDIEYYKICEMYENGYLLFNEKFVKLLLHKSKECKYLIKTYLVYYKYSKCYGKCQIEQSRILSHIGLSSNGNNRMMLTKINSILIESKLISINKITNHINGITKTMLTIIADDYEKVEL